MTTGPNPLRGRSFVALAIVCVVSSLLLCVVFAQLIPGNPINAIMVVLVLQPAVWVGLLFYSISQPASGMALKRQAAFVGVLLVAAILLFFLSGGGS